MHDGPHGKHLNGCPRRGIPRTVEISYTSTYESMPLLFLEGCERIHVTNMLLKNAKKNFEKKLLTFQARRSVVFQ
jgi:hypothetical protein